MTLTTAEPPRMPLATILVIEDEHQLCEILDEELAAAGYKVVIACNGEEGLEKIQEFEPDLVICDRVMPVMSGYELIERIRGVYPQYANIPFVFLTALTDPRDRIVVSTFKPAAYLEKPLDFDELLDTIDQVLNDPAR